ncbi:hypothetical protein [Nocardia brasiliensis]|uniref:hypothetical protein n=1 Tax=Nocardia brasiliensis TaxID=37326 RepID=UPI002458C42E|nr:hypothetical protein [Nocardia brasiliensis]
MHTEPVLVHDNATEMCRIRVRFGNPPLELSYRDERSVAERFAAAVYRIGAEVIIDGAESAGLRPLPCRTLWNMDG